MNSKVNLVQWEIFCDTIFKIRVVAEFDCFENFIFRDKVGASVAAVYIFSMSNLDYFHYQLIPYDFIDNAILSYSMPIDIFMPT